MIEDDRSLAHAMVESGLVDVDFYWTVQNGFRPVTPLDAAWHYVRIGEKRGYAPSGMFDPVYYRQVNPDLSGIGNLAEHFVRSGRAEGRIGSLAAHLVAEDLDEIAVKEGCIPQPAADRDSPDYINALALALRSVDTDPRYFSRKFYLERYPDMAGQTIDPLFHFLKFGRHEGRVTNMLLLKGVHIDEDLIDPALPFVLVGVHEASKTGAPIVGMDLARALQSDHNVVFVSLRDGPLVETAKTLYPVVIVASQYDHENEFFVDFIAERYPVKDAIFSSSACIPFIRPLASLDCRITCLVHEFLEYMIHTHKLICLCDLLVFSSRELLKSWQYMLDDLERPPETVMVLPQPPSATTNQRVMSRQEAREMVAAATGLDLDDAVLVLGAGQVQIRKGTDIFVQVGNQLKREDGKYVTIWIGEQVSELDVTFGVWFHAQLARSRDGDGELAVHFEPAGPLYPVLMDAADVFLVTSRLDPLPNVALDAAARDVPVVAFAGATGLADIADRGEMRLIEVEIGAVDEMIRAIRSVCADKTAALPRAALAGAGQRSGRMQP